MEYNSLDAQREVGENTMSQAKHDNGWIQKAIADCLLLSQMNPAVGSGAIKTLPQARQSGHKCLLLPSLLTHLILPDNTKVKNSQRQTQNCT